MVVTAGVRAKSVQLADDDCWAAAVAGFVQNRNHELVQTIRMPSIDVLDEVFVEDAQLERIELFGIGADSVVVVFDDQYDRKIAFHGEANGFVEFALSRSRIANGGDHNVGFSFKLHRPSNTTTWKSIGSCWRGNAPYVFGSIRVVPWHLPALARRASFGEVRRGQLSIRHAATKNHRSVAIVWEKVVAFVHLSGDDGERFVSHAGHLKPTFALPMQYSLAAISFAAEIHQF